VVMEYCSCSVEDILSFCPEFKFTELQIAAVSASVIKGLAFLHAYGISHRDIKSGNVLLKATGEVKLADFGVSHKLQHERDKMKTLAGSPYWCAPELITADSYDNKVDIWAAGIVAIEMAETRPPHWDMEPLQVIFHIPKEPPPKLKNPERWSPEFLDFLDKCLKKNPEERATAKQLLCHPFILTGSSNQILEPVLKQTLPVLLPRKQEDLMEEQEEEDASLNKGTIVAVDKSTYRASVVLSGPTPDQNKEKAKDNAPTSPKQSAQQPKEPAKQAQSPPTPKQPGNTNNNNKNAKASEPPVKAAAPQRAAPATGNSKPSKQQNRQSKK